MKLLVAVGVIMTVVGCAAMNGTKPGTPAWDAMTMRNYSVAPAQVLAAAVQIFTDLGIEIASTDSTLGLLKGTKGGSAGIPYTYQLIVTASGVGSNASLRISGDVMGSSKLERWPEKYAAVFGPLDAALTH